MTVQDIAWMMDTVWMRVNEPQTEEKRRLYIWKSRKGDGRKDKAKQGLRTEKD